MDAVSSGGRKNSGSECVKELKAASGLCREPDGPEPYLPMILSDLDHAERMEQVSGYGMLAREADSFEYP